MMPGVIVRRAKKIKPGVSIPYPKPKDIARFMSKVEESENGCWLWTGTLDPQGYGMIRVAGKTLWVHRFAVAVFGHRRIAGREVDHKCRCRNCVNPKHLRPVTPGRNRADIVRGHAGDGVAPF